MDEAAGHDVAVKALGARAAWSMSERARLRIAFAATSGLTGPGIARVHEYGELSLPGGLAVPYLVRELVTGPSLEERLGCGSLPVDEALGVVASVADALATAHRSGVVHGNLVPGNVVFGPDGVKVTDFGLWSLRDHLTGVSRPTANTPSVLSYAAPERLSGEPASPAADMYSLGVLFVACLSGIAAGGTAGAWPAADPEEPVAPSLASLWAACLGANPQGRPSAAHAAFMSRQILAAHPVTLSGRDDLASSNGHAGEPAAAGPAVRGPAGQAGPAADSQAGGREPTAGRGGRGSSGPGGRGPGSGGPGRHGTGRRTRRMGQALRGRAGLVSLGGVAGVTAAVVMLTQFLASPSAQVNGPSASPTVPVSQPSATPPAHPRPSVNATASVLASSPPSPPQALNQIRDTLRRDVAGGQVRQDVAVDLDNLIAPIRSDLAAGNFAPIPQLVAGLRTKLTTRLAEGAVTQAAGRQLGSELTTLLRSLPGR